MTDNDYCNTFSQSFSWFQTKAHQLAVEKGWYDKDRDGVHKLGLVMGELGEAIEAIRDQSISKKILGYSELEEEIADVFIRLMDHGGSECLNLGDAMVDMLGYLQRYSEQEIRLAFAMIKLLGIFPDARAAETIITKHQYNQSRPYRHGGKLY